MYLATYTFTGDPTDLTDRYRRLIALFPVEDLILHVAVATDSGLVIVDTCPDKAAFEAFSTSPLLAQALASSGLPAPEVVGRGEIVNSVIRQDVSV